MSRDLNLFQLPVEVMESVCGVLGATIPVNDEENLEPESSVNRGSSKPSDGLEAKSRSSSPTYTQPSLQGSSCSTCLNATFGSAMEQRDHFKSDWHRYNLKRKLKQLTTVAEQEFEDLTELSSIEASDSELESDQESDESESVKSSTNRLAKLMNDLDMVSGESQVDPASGQVTISRSVGSPYVSFQIPHPVYIKYVKKPQASDNTAKDQDPCAFLIYKQILFPKRDQQPPLPTLLSALQSMQFTSAIPPKYWLLMMTAGGHFAAAVFSCSTTGAAQPVVHKTYHRYTTRRKQGGAQSSNDNSKGKANSAGSSLRRYNEQALQEDIKKLLTEWKAYISSATHIFYYAGARARNSLFFDDQLLSFNDPRVRSFPFITKRPTLSELTRCFKELTTIKLQQIAPPPETPAKSTADSSPKPSQKQSVQFIVPQLKPKLPEGFEKLVELAQKGKVDLLREHLAKKFASGQGQVDAIRTRFADELGTSLLHVASAASQAEVVAFLLDLGADPTLREAEGKQRSAYEVANEKESRDAFRRAYATHPDQWDWPAAAGVPSPLTNEMEERQKEREREKKRKQREKQKAAKEANKETAAALAAAAEAEAQKTKEEDEAKLARAKRAAVINRLSAHTRDSIGMTPEQRMRIDREKRALAAESRLRAQQNKCSACGRLLEGLTTFDKFQFRYCSLLCCQEQNLLHA